MEWSPKQDEALTLAARWMRDESPSCPLIFRLFGFAGTGKSTLAKYLASGASGIWLYASYTGKAANVMRQKGCDGASTIHSLIYRPNGESRTEELRLLALRIHQLEQKTEPSNEERKELDSRREQLTLALLENRPRFSLWLNSPLMDADVQGLIVDEVSMVDERLGRDLESFRKKILVMGDPAQLPPIGGGGYYTSQKPDILLTEVHRHARESGILRLATDIREGRQMWSEGDHGDVQILRRGDETISRLASDADQVLVGRNASRRAINKSMRQDRASDNPIVGDRVICLRNDRELGLFNGAQYVVSEIQCDEEIADALLSGDDGHSVSCSFWTHHMTGREKELKEKPQSDRRAMMEFDYSYAITVHKSQGSAWSSALAIDESRDFREDARRWLYTAVTRASRQLTLVIP